MRICVEVPAGLSRAMARVANALALYAPRSVELVTEPEAADLVVLHVIGHPETVEAVKRIRTRGARYAIMQYCMRTTQQASTHAWRDIWGGAAAVWSYYDLGQLIADDGGHGIDFPFHYAPLGVDSWAFYPTLGGRREYTMLTSGYVAETECVREVCEAVRRVRGKHFHLGPQLALPPQVARCELGITDDRLAAIYRSTKYVAGLRRVEGFELPAAEGLVCGARPVVFDRPHYRQWFGPWAVFVPECEPEQLTNVLEGVFRGEYRAVQPHESADAAARFDWARLVPAFWAMAGVREAVVA